MTAVAISVSVKSIPLLFGPAVGGAPEVLPPVEQLLIGEFNGLALDFRLDAYAVRQSSASEALLGDEWNGIALDFTEDNYFCLSSTSAEMLLGSGSVSADNGLGLDFTTDQYATRN